jgi:transposase
MARSVVSLPRKAKRLRENHHGQAWREITDRAWEQIEPLLPKEGGKRGGQWRDHRTVINGILWKLRTGSPWRDLPERYGPWQPASIASIAGDAMAPGSAFWPMPRPRATRLGTWSGR